MSRRSHDSADSPSAATNRLVSQALTDLAEFVGKHAHLPALTYITCSAHYDIPHIDLWVEHPDDVAAWARTLKADVIERDDSDADESFTVTEALLSEPRSAEVRVTHLAYHDKKPSDSPEPEDGASAG